MSTAQPGSHTVSARYALRQAAAHLARAGIHPADREARWLLEHLVGTAALLPLLTSGRPLTPVVVRRFNSLVRKRAQRYPLQYLLGTIEFAGAELTVAPAALIPRPETENLVQRVLAHLPDHAAALSCVDLGTGSGCLAIALSRALPRSRWIACDSSPAAVRLAADNAERNQVADRIDCCRSNWFEISDPRRTFDLIVTNPPYIPAGECLAPELDYEPPQALFGGPDGLAAWRAIIPALPCRLAARGLFAAEFGLHQEPHLRELAVRAGLPEPQFEADLSGRVRYMFVVGR